MWNLKYGTNEPIYKTEIDSETENRLVAAKWERGGSGLDWEFVVSRCRLLHLEWISNEAPCCIAQRTISNHLIEHDGG